MSEPRTSAGRALLGVFPPDLAEPTFPLKDRVLAIEAEARAVPLDVPTLARALGNVTLNEYADALADTTALFDLAAAILDASERPAAQEPELLSLLDEWLTAFSASSQPEFPPEHLYARTRALLGKRAPWAQGTASEGEE